MSKTKKSVLLLVPHADDELLSFGGLIQRLVNRGDTVYTRLYTCGGPCSNAPSGTRLDEFKKVQDHLGVPFGQFTVYDFDNDGRLDQVPSCELTTDIDKYIQELKPDEVYCGAYSEHSDHQALYKAFMGAARLKAGYIPRLMAVGTYPFSDQLYSNPDGGKIFLPMTDEEFKRKMDAFKLYKSQLRPSPSPLGLEGLEAYSKYLGMLCGAPYAELYYQLRYIHTYE